MAYETKNKGALFVNDKEGHENWPDRKGTLNVEGKDYWLSGWLKKDKNGNQYLSLAVQPKEKKEPRGGGGATAGQGEDLSDEIPFITQF